VDEVTLYRMANTIYNRKLIFSSLRDNARDLKDILNNHFKEVWVRIRGGGPILKGSTGDHLHQLSEQLLTDFKI
jgi:hypothetical protein